MHTTYLGTESIGKRLCTVAIWVVQKQVTAFMTSAVFLNHVAMMLRKQVRCLLPLLRMPTVSPNTLDDARCCTVYRHAVCTSSDYGLQVCTLQKPTRAIVVEEMVAGRDAPDEMIKLIAACRRDDPDDRPSIDEVHNWLSSITWCCSFPCHELTNNADTADKTSFLFLISQVWLVECDVFFFWSLYEYCPTAR